MSNRRKKIKLFLKNDKCFYCGTTMILTNIKNIPSGQSLPQNAATIEHRISRYNSHRWIRKKKNECRQVLCCYKCNHDRSVKETLCLSRAEVLRRSHGFSLSPRGRPGIINPVPTVKEALKKLNA